MRTPRGDFPSSGLTPAATPSALPKMTGKIVEFAESFYPLFYLKTPSSSSFKDVSEVPNYLQQVLIPSVGMS